MEWRSNLRRTQSLSVAMSCDQPVWMEAERRDKTTVSHLIARYQSTSGGNTPNQETVRNSEPKPKQIMTSLSESNESHLEAQIWRNEENSEKERSRAKTTLVRSKSMGSLQTSAGSIQVLKALFESKADTQSKADSDLRPVNVLSSYKEADIMNEDDEVIKIFAGKPKIQIPVNTLVNGEKDAHPARKVVKQTRVERRKTVGGIDFETIAASQADEKRRSIADFRDSSFIQTKEKLCVSVKAISALYLSKVQPQGSNHSPQKLVQDHSPESGKGVKLIKMAEDSRQRKVNLPLHASPSHQTSPEGTSEESFQQSMPSQLSKEKLHQQRQKCELRRLLRHTHPELKELDDVVDEELAEVLSSETGATTGETGYEGEVLSRRLIFENCVKASPFTAKRHMTLGTVGRGNISTTSVVSEEHEKRPKSESVNVIMEGEEILTSEEVPNTECEEEMRRIDVQATRRMFENQSVNTHKQYPKDKLQNATLSGVGSGTIQNKKHENLLSENISNARTKSHDVTDLPREHQPSVNVLHEFSGREELFSGETDYKDGATIPPDPENSEEIIQTRVTLFHNNPFITTNIEREHSSEQTSKPHSPASNSGEAEDCLKTNVKSRTHLFESMPFDRIRHQNQDDIETMVENMRETLHVLYKVDAIRSGGSIIEVNETMNAKKAMFTVSEGGPEIKYDEVAEGGARNFILHLLPRTNLKPQITYLKEDNKGGTQATVVNVPVHQHLFSTNQDTEFKTANVTQVVEDILNQDNSLRKGVIIQEGLDHRAEVIVYSLYYYFDEEDVKSYFPPRDTVYNEPEPEIVEVCKTDIQQLIKGSVESTINCLLETSKDQTNQGLIRPEITEKGNVKLFKSCIEKGDLEYLKYLQAEPAVQEELTTNRDVAGRGTELHREQKGDHAEESEWVPVDVKKLKNMFSGDHRPPQPKQNACTRFVQSTTISPAHGKSQSSTESNAGVFSDKQPTEPLWEGDTQRLKESCNFKVVPQGSGQHLETQGDGCAHKAELLEQVDDKIANLQTAIDGLQQATIEAESLLHLSREKLSFLDMRVEAELHPENEVPIDDPVMKPRWDECPSASNITSEHKSDYKMENGNTCHKDTNSEDTQTKEACRKMDETSTKEAEDSFMRNADNSETIPAQQEGEEVIFQGTLQAALNSLEKSNLNVTRGDFREAMIYRQSPKSGEERSQNANASLQKHTEKGLCPLTALESNQEKLRQEVFEADVDPLKQTEISNKEVTCALLEDRRPVRSKPAIPPKPEHLKLKHVQSTTAKNLEVTQTDSVTLGEQTPQTLAMTSSSLKDEHEPHVLKIHSKANSVPDSVDLQRRQVFNEALGRPHSDATKNIPNCHTQRNIAADKRSPQKSMTHKDERRAGAQEQCQKFSIKNAPVKPKRSKMSQPDNKNPKDISGEKNSSILPDVFEEPQQSLAGPSCKKQNSSKVEMRDKKGRIETESERRQRLSVHMDEIMKGDMTTAMEIFDNFRKQEELQSLLSKVEEIEQATSEVDVRSLRGVFEDAPDWVVNSDKKKQKKVKEEDKEEKAPLARANTELKASRVFGDLERACEEITSLKEQTLDRLMDIEGAIKKALYSVSTLKSDSDINGLSCLFRESLGTVQGSPPSGNISKISIGSSRTKPAPSEQSPNSVPPTSHNVSSEEASAEQQASPPSSPTFISIQTAARATEKTKAPPPDTKLCPTCQNSSKTEETFRTTKTLTCKTPAENKKRDPRRGCPKQSSHNQPDPKRELSELKVPTEGDAILAAKTVTENYEKTDNFGNRFFSSKKSTVSTDQPETTTSTD